MEESCGNAYNATRQNQAWRRWLLLALYARQRIGNRDAVWWSIWAWQQGIVNLSQE